MNLFRALNNTFNYNPETGEFTNKITGRKASTTKSRYIYIKVRIGNIGKTLLAHRAAWIMYYGDIDNTKCIDHINRNKTDNRIENLRLVTIQENAQNSKARNSISDIPGLYLCKTNKTNPYRVSLMVNGNHIHGGYFPTVEQAQAKCIQMRRELYSGNTY
jgi:hypothetical protein